MRFEDSIKKVTGEIRLEVYRKNKLVKQIDDHNLVVDAGRMRLAELAAGKVGNYSNSYISHIGLGSGSEMEKVGDTELENQQLFPLTSIELNGRDVKCNFLISENEANGLSIRELGLFCADGTMFSHRVRRNEETGEVGVIEKFSDIELKGFWILHF